MSSLNEAFVLPLMNMYGTNKIMTDNPKQDYPKIIADMIELLFNSNYDQYLEDKYSFQLSSHDYKQFVKTCFYDEMEKISQDFILNLKNELEKKNLGIKDLSHPIQSCIEGPAFYYEVYNEYETQIISIGPYRHPVWLHVDESSE
jgi:hypothetical protein